MSKSRAPSLLSFRVVRLVDKFRARMYYLDAGYVRTLRPYYFCVISKKNCNTLIGFLHIFVDLECLFVGS